MIKTGIAMVIMALLFIGTSIVLAYDSGDCEVDTNDNWCVIPKKECKVTGDATTYHCTNQGNISSLWCSCK